MDGGAAGAVRGGAAAGRGAAAVDGVVAAARGPRAFVAYERREAEELLLALAACGMRVGRDVSLVVMSDHDVQCGGVAVTTFVIPFEGAGQTCVEQLLEKIADPAKTFPLTLVKYAYVTGMESVGRAGRGVWR